MDVKSWQNGKSDELSQIYGQNLTIPFERITSLGDYLISSFKQGSRLYFLGNGGSASESMHIAAEFTGHCIKNHKPLPVMSLCDSQSALTAIANDYGFENVFMRQVEAFVGLGDTVIGLSTSGKSENVLRAGRSAAEIGARFILWTGSRKSESREDIEIWKAESESTPRIQEIHLIWGHLLAEYIEEFIETNIDT
jgi:D-sedoheptulose 7-phosphate isomerase